MSEMSSTLSSRPSEPEAAPPAPPESELVQLSVHSLPDPAALQRTRQGRLKMLLVLAVCAAPVIASYITYYLIRPQARTNHGELIAPTRPMPASDALPLTDLQGHAVSTTALKGQWLLLTVAGGECDARCEKHLYWQRQVREVLGKEKDKVDRVWLINDAQPMRRALAPAMKDATVLRVKPSDLAQWLAPAPGHAMEDHWYLVDPRGDWMMRFPADAEPRKVQKDLERLLKAASSWDQEGRP
jgi:cytochrome oxidase Cu insertion factor (SCO1/SenC/PrrC family)